MRTSYTVQVEHADHSLEVLPIVGTGEDVDLLNDVSHVTVVCRPSVLNVKRTWDEGFKAGKADAEELAAMTWEGLKGKPIEIDRDVEIADLRKANEQLRTDNKVLNDRIANLRRTVDNEHNDNETLRAQVLDQQRRLDVQFTTLEELRKDEAELRRINERLRTDNALLNDRIRSLRDQLGREHEDTARLVADVRRTTREACEKEFTESGAYRSAYALGRKQGHIDAGWHGGVINAPAVAEQKMQEAESNLRSALGMTASEAAANQIKRPTYNAHFNDDGSIVFKPVKP